LVYGVLEPPLPPTKVISRIPCTVTLPIELGARCEFTVRNHDLRRFDAQSGRNLEPAHFAAQP